MVENTLTGLIPSLYAGMDTVSREQTGYIPSVFRDASAERAALDEAITFPITPAGNASDITPAMAIPEPTEQTIGNGTITITKARTAEFGFVGEAKLGLDNGPGYNIVQADMFSQALRVLTNEIEVDLSVVAAAGAARGVGAPNAAPFDGDIDDVSQLGKILSDNGAPASERQLVIDTTAGASLRTLYGINTDRDYSKASFQQQGVLVTPHGMAIRETGQGVSHTGGTGASATTDAAGYAVGATAITLAAAGTGTLKDGDLITFAGDSNQYIVDADVAAVSGGALVLRSPGLMKAIVGATALTVTGVGVDVDYEVGGVCFYRNAIALVARAPALPEGGDAATDRMVMVDPRSGLAFTIAVYKGFHKVRFDVSLAWGVKVVQPRHTALLAY
jgi:hypothetical protein